MLPDDDLSIETCRSDLSVLIVNFRLINFTVSAFFGVVLLIIHFDHLPSAFPNSFPFFKPLLPYNKCTVRLSPALVLFVFSLNLSVHVPKE
jgi:hypothetical protein